LIYNLEKNYSPYILTSITNPDSYLPLNQSISYTAFNKVEAITDTLLDETIKKIEFTYGVDQQRKKSKYTYSTTTIKKYFFNASSGILNNSFSFILLLIRLKLNYFCLTNRTLSSFSGSTPAGVPNAATNSFTQNYLHSQLMICFHPYFQSIEVNFNLDKIENFWNQYGSLYTLHYSVK
jgi:hypothetical protein